MASSSVIAGHRPIDGYTTVTSPNLNGDTDIPEDWKKDVRICIAEDNRVNRKLLGKLLGRIGYVQFSAYENGLEAVEALRQKASEGEPYHLVLMDTSMPVLDGFGATRLIREDPTEAIREVPIIAMQAYASRENTEKALAEGMDDYISKPMRLTDIRDKLNAFIDPSQLYVAEHPEPSTIMDEILLQLRPKL